MIRHTLELREMLFCKFSSVRVFHQNTDLCKLACDCLDGVMAALDRRIEVVGFEQACNQLEVARYIFLIKLKLSGFLGILLYPESTTVDCLDKCRRCLRIFLGELRCYEYQAAVFLISRLC